MKTLIFLILLLAPLSVLADDDHLLPEDSVFVRGMPPASHFSIGDETLDDPHGYYKSVLSVLHRAYERDIVGRLIVLTSFQNEFAIALSREGEHWKIIYLKPDTFIRNFELLKDYKSGAIRARGPDGESRTAEVIAELEAELPPGIDDVVVEKCALEIDDALGRALYSLWSEMLFRTRYVDHRPVLPDSDHRPSLFFNSVNYHFSFDYGGYGPGRLTGHIWSPDKASITGRFVAITNMMKEACTTKDTKVLADMRDNVEALLSELDETQY